MSKYNYNDWDEDYVFPYKSKKKIKKNKSNHKHNYEEIIGKMSVKNSDRPHYVIAKKCSICGKVEIVEFFITSPVPNKPLRKLVSVLDEIKEMYPNLQVVDIE